MLSRFDFFKVLVIDLLKVHGQSSSGSGVLLANPPELALTLYSCPGTVDHESHVKSLLLVHIGFAGHLLQLVNCGEDAPHVLEKGMGRM